MSAAQERRPRLASLETRYRSRVALKYENVEFLGLPYLREERPLRLEEIYVPLSLTREPDGERMHVPKALEDAKHLVVLGDPGSGKSTLIKVLAYSFARMVPTQFSKHFGELIPIPIILRDYNVSGWKEPLDLLRDYAATLEEALRGEVTSGWLLAKLRSGQGVLLVDGLDEVGRLDDRKLVREVIQLLLWEMPDSLAVVTTRAVGYEEAPLDAPLSYSTASSGGRPMPVYGVPAKCAFQRFRIAPFSPEEIDHFVTRWYTAREREQAQREKSLQSFRAALAANERIRALASNPFLLTLMALIHRVTAALPSGRVKLYDRVAEVYLETIQRFRGLQSYDAPLEHMKRWLGEVGWQMQNRRAQQGQDEPLASRSEVLLWLAAAMSDDSEQPTQDAERFLEYVRARSGLLIEQGNGRFGFVHLTFQEYFAAWKLRALLRRFDELIHICSNYVSDSRWHETLVLLFELLAEFPGAGDDLVDALEKASSGQSDPVQWSVFFQLLIEDSQSGLSRAAVMRVASFALSTGATTSSSVWRGNFFGLPTERVWELGHPWVEQRLWNADPSEVEEHFFEYAGWIEGEKWADELAHFVEKRGQLPWATKHVMAVVSKGKLPSIAAWAFERLDLSNWLSGSFPLHPTPSYYALDSLIELSNRSANHRLLAELGALGAVLRVEGLKREIVAALSGRAHPALRREPGPAYRKAYLGGGIPVLGMHTLPEVPNMLLLTFVVAREHAAKNATGGSMLMQPFVLRPVAGFTPTVTHGRSWITSLSERLALQPHVSESELSALISKLHGWRNSTDDWTRVLAVTSLVALGEGSPEMVIARSELFNRILRDEHDFSVPSDLMTCLPEANRQIAEGLRLLTMGTLEHWVDDQWFDNSLRDDPRHPAFLLCASPPLFFERLRQGIDAFVHT